MHCFLPSKKYSELYATIIKTPIYVWWLCAMSAWLRWNYISKNSLISRLWLATREKYDILKAEEKHSHPSALKVGARPGMVTAHTGWCWSAGSPCWPGVSSAPASFFESWAKCVYSSVRKSVGLSWKSLWWGPRKTGKGPSLSLLYPFHIHLSFLTCWVPRADAETVGCLTPSHNYIYGENTHTNHRYNKFLILCHWQWFCFSNRTVTYKYIVQCCIARVSIQYKRLLIFLHYHFDLCIRSQCFYLYV